MADRPSRHRRRESEDKRRSESPTNDQQQYRQRSPSHTTSHRRRTAIAPVMDGEEAGKSEVTKALQRAQVRAAEIEAARRDAKPEQVRREDSQASKHREDEMRGWNDPFARSHDTGERRDKRAQRALDDETIGEEEPKYGTEQNELRGLFEGWPGLGDVH
ncbi:hypothetical protein JCM11641_007038 [Rhodosporidiobolus odoratus]